MTNSIDPLLSIKLHLGLKISLPAYQAAVNGLMTIAFKDTSGARVAAQVLLASYNGYAFAVNVPDLALLDETHYAHALAVIRGRVERGLEPHEAIPNGPDLFDKLWKLWEPVLHLSNRYPQRA